MLFSATLAPEIARLTSSYQKDPVRIEVASQGTSAEQIEQELCFTSRQGKITLLKKLLDECEGSVLVFSRTKHGASKLSHQVQQMGHAATEIHSNRSLGQRRAALDGFKSGKYRVLVATDVAARGIDVKDISLVLNYDLPDAAEDYVHRIGRTGRAGKKGRAVSFATPDQQKEVRNIERLIKKSLPISKHSEIAHSHAAHDERSDRPERPAGSSYFISRNGAQGRSASPARRPRRRFSPVRSGV